MNKLHALKRSRADLRMMKMPSSFVLTLFFLFGSLTVFGQPETRTTLSTTNVQTTTEKSKAENLKNENPEVYFVSTKILTIDQDIRNFIERNQLSSSVMDQYLMKITSICADCLQEKVLESSAVFTHIKNSTNSTLLLDFMEEFLTNLSNQ